MPPHRDSSPNSTYVKKYKEAFAQYKSKQWEKAIEIAKFNLTDPNLPRYWQVKNYILIVAAEQDFEEAEKYRLLGEKVYEEAKEHTPEDAELEQLYLGRLRQDLDDLDDLKEGQTDEVRKWWHEQGIVSEDEDQFGEGEEGDEEGDEEFEDGAEWEEDEEELEDEAEDDKVTEGPGEEATLEATEEGKAIKGLSEQPSALPAPATQALSIRTKTNITSKELSEAAVEETGGATNGVAEPQRTGTSENVIVAKIMRHQQRANQAQIDSLRTQANDPAVAGKGVVSQLATVQAISLEAANAQIDQDIRELEGE